MDALSRDMQAALALLSYQYLCQGRHRKAVSLLELLVLHAPSDPKLRLAQGFALLRCGRARQANAVLATLEDSREPIVHFLRSQALRGCGLNEQAAAALAQYGTLLRSAETAHSTGDVALPHTKP